MVGRRAVRAVGKEAAKAVPAVVRAAKAEAKRVDKAGRVVVRVVAVAVKVPAAARRVDKAGRVVIRVVAVAVKVPAAAKRVARAGKVGKVVDKVVRVIAKAVPGVVRRVAKAEAARRVVLAAVRAVPGVSSVRCSTDGKLHGGAGVTSPAPPHLPFTRGFFRRSATPLALMSARNRFASLASASDRSRNAALSRSSRSSRVPTSSLLGIPQATDRAGYAPPPGSSP